MKQMRILIPIVAALALGAALAPAFSQQMGRNYNVKTMNFDLWCQETQRWPADRCDRRAAADYAAFEEFRTQVERYEVPFLQQQQRDLAISRDLLNNNPVSNPLSQDPQRQAQTPTQQPKIPSP